MVSAHVVGWTAATLVLGGVACQRAGTLRAAVVAAALVCIGCGSAAGLRPWMPLQLALLPVNVVQLLSASPQHLQRPASVTATGGGFAPLQPFDEQLAQAPESPESPDTP